MMTAKGVKKIKRPQCGHLRVRSTSQFRLSFGAVSLLLREHSSIGKQASCLFRKDQRQENIETGLIY